MPIQLYFGPNNDPGDVSGTPHWQYPHPVDFHNPAFTIVRNVDSSTGVLLSVDINFAIRNRDTTAVHTLDSVKLYAAACGMLGSVGDVNALVNLVTSAPQTLIREWTLVDTHGVASMDVPIHSAVNDACWTPAAPCNFVIPVFSPGFMIIATLDAGDQAPHLNDFAEDPSVAIWLG